MVSVPKFERIICYVGDDDVFFDNLKKSYERFGHASKSLTLRFENISIKNTSNILENYIDFFIKNLPHVVFWDFWDVEDPVLYAGLAQTMSVLKKNHEMRSIPIFGLFPSRMDVIKHSYLFSCGMVYAHVKGEGNESLIADSYYISFEDNLSFPRYAQATHIDLPHDIYPLSSIASITADALMVETDFEPVIDQDIYANTNLFEEFKVRKFDVSYIDNSAICHHFMNTVELRITYPGPWDEVTEDSMHRDTMQTWLDVSRESFCFAQATILIVNKDRQMWKQILQKEMSEIYFYPTNHLEKTLNLIKSLRPAVIFFALDDEMAEGVADGIPEHLLPNNFNTLQQVIGFIRSIESYLPIIVTFDNPSSSEAIKKVLGYDSIISHNSMMSFDLVYSLVEKLKNHFFRNKVQEVRQGFHAHDPRRIIELVHNVKITSLTEHEITFLSDIQYPIFSVIKMTQPLEFFITIVPTIRDLEQKGVLYHYMGFIHSVEEQDLQIFRQFVNQLIFRKPKVFAFDMKAYLESQEKIVETEKKMPANKDEYVRQKKIAEETIVRTEVTRPRVSGLKSKL